MTILRLSIFVQTFVNRCIGKYAVNALPKIRLENLVKHRSYATAIKLKVDSQNVVSSGLPDISGFENVYLHDLIWEKMERRWSNHTALICLDTGRSYTYSQLRKACGRLATSLRKSKLLPGDTIAVVLPNIPEFAIILLAANEAGLCTTLINPAYTTYEIKKQVENTDAQAIFTFPAKYADINTSIENNSKIKLPIVIVNDGSGTASIAKTIKFDDLIRDDIEEFSVSQKINVNYEDTVLMPYSSGTTGLPKSIETSHRNIVANILQSSFPIIFPGMEATEHHQDIVPIILPMYHAYGLTVMYCYLRIGAKLVCIPQFSMNKFIKLLEDHRCTVLHMVPPIIQMMAYNERITSRHVASVKLIQSGAAPLGEESIAKFQSRVSNSVTFIQGYGASELSPIATVSVDAPPTSCGYLVPNTQMRIVGTRQDNLGKNLIPHEAGEIYIRGPQVMKGYYKNPQATADTMDGDWYKTGDLGYYTEQGLYVEGRLKEIIKVKGFQVAPIELEEVIRGHDKILDVAVIGVAHDKYGEIPKAFVVPKTGVKICENEIKEYVAKHVAKFKQLGYVQIIKSIPKTASGKILRRELEKL